MKVFEKGLNFLRRLPPQLIQTKLALGSGRIPVVSFTFDDIPETAFTNGATILESNGALGTFYLSGGLVDTVEPDRRLISTEQLQALQQAGHEIGCHTFSHFDVGTESAHELKADLERNQAFLTSLCGDVVLDSFAYPYGSVSLWAKLALQNRFKTCRGCGAGINQGLIDLGLLKGIEINVSLEDQAVSHWIERAVSSKGWLIFILHDVTEEPTQWGCTPLQLEHAVTVALKAGCEIAPVRQALHRCIGSDQCA